MKPGSDVYPEPHGQSGWFKDRRIVFGGACGDTTGVCLRAVNTLPVQEWDRRRKCVCLKAVLNHTPALSPCLPPSHLSSQPHSTNATLPDQTYACDCVRVCARVCACVCVPVSSPPSVSSWLDCGSSSAPCDGVQRWLSFTSFCTCPPAFLPWMPKPASLPLR